MLWSETWRAPSARERPLAAAARWRAYQDGSLYSLLGLEPNASLDSVRSAYRRLAKRVHPDVNPSPRAAHDFKVVTRAYRALCDRVDPVTVEPVADEEVAPALPSRRRRLFIVALESLIATGLSVTTVFGSLQVLGLVLHMYR